MTNRTQVVLTGVERCYVAYYGVDRGHASFEKGTSHEEAPVGAILRQTVRVLEDILTAEETKLPGMRDFVLEAGPRTFLRGRVVEGDEAAALLLPLEIRELTAMLGSTVKVVAVGGEIPKVVAIRRSDDTEVVILLREGDIAPPPDASPYAVGESPEELAAAETSKPKRRFCPNCFMDDHPVDPEIALTAEEAEEVRAKQEEARVRAAAGVTEEEDFEDFCDDDEFATEGIVEVDPTDPQGAQPEYGGEGGN